MPAFFGIPGWIDQRLRLHLHPGLLRQGRHLPLICPPNHFCAGGESILPCANNSFSPEGSVSSDNCTCRNGFLQNFVVCPEGMFGNGLGDCKPCPIGTYNNRTDQRQCAACPILQPTSPVGSTSILRCDCSRLDGACVCPAGTFGTRYPDCTLCPTNTYSDLPNQTECTTCPVLRGFSAPGSKSVLECGCQAGTYGVVGSSTPCQPCPEDKPYSPPGSQYISECGCPEGFVSIADGCVSCQNAIQPIPCPADRPLSVPFLVSDAYCSPCADGSNATADALLNATVIVNVTTSNSTQESTDTCSCPALYIPTPDGCVVCGQAVAPVPCPAQSPFSPVSSTALSQCSARSICFRNKTSLRHLLAYKTNPHPFIPNGGLERDVRAPRPLDSVRVQCRRACVFEGDRWLHVEQ